MPWTAWLFLTGAIAISAAFLPPDVTVVSTRYRNRHSAFHDVIHPNAIGMSYSARGMPVSPSYVSTCMSTRTLRRRFSFP